MYISRRRFLAGCAAGATAACMSRTPAHGTTDDPHELLARLISNGAIGVGACAVAGSEICWSGAAGWADIAAEQPRTVDTIQNIASITKTITATAVMQQVEQGALALDADVNDYLPFQLRNPRFPEEPLTLRHLLTHHASLKDGPAYEEGYACGDPSVELRDWLVSIFDAKTPPDVKPYFIPKAPGEHYAYSNIGYGILGLIVQEVSGTQFAAYTRDRILQPLGMTSSGWLLKDIDAQRHAKPYVPAGEISSADARGLVARELDGGVKELCLYSFPNYPDGLLRTMPTDFAQFLRAILNGGELDGNHILATDTLDTMFSNAIRRGGSTLQGLCWVGREAEDGTLWGHDGGDPGVVTVMRIDRETRTGALVFVNGGGRAALRQALDGLLAYARTR